MRKIKNAVLSKLARKTLERNRVFEERHKGESCYLIGNGASIKYFDLERFSDKTVIGCNALFFHREFHKLNVSYYFSGHPFLYYPYWTNPYTGQRVKNTLGPLYRRKMQIYNNINYFVSLSNYFGLRTKNTYYLHHFDKAFENYQACSLSGKFTAMAGALPAMLGIAIHMGFTDITLVGCDYSFYPQAIGHFFEVDAFKDSFSNEPVSNAFLANAKRHATLRTVTPNANYRGHVLPHISYLELTGDKPVCKENHEIVKHVDLISLNQGGMNYRTFHEGPKNQNITRTN